MSYQVLFVVVAVAIGLVAAVLVYLQSETHRVAKVISKIQGPPTVPLLGNLHQLAPLKHHERIPFFLEWQQKYPKVFRVWVGLKPIIMISDPDIVKEILRSSQHLSKAFSYRFLYDWLGLGLLTSTGDKWKSRRRLITPSFHFEILRGFSDTFVEQSKVFVDKLQAQTAKDSGYFDIFPFITRLALDIICETAMGENIRAQETINNPYVKAVYFTSRATLDRMLQPWEWQETFYKNWTPKGIAHRKALEIMHSFTLNVIKHRREHHQRILNGESEADISETKRKRAFLDMLLLATDEDGNKLSDVDIREEVDTFMFEGHDTTSAGLAWMIQLVGMDKRVQALMHEEIDRVLGDKPCPSYDDLADLKYVDIVIKESLRLFPSVPMIGRILDDDITVGNVTVPRSTEVALLFFSMHRNKDFWGEDAEQFVPERWLDESRLPAHSYVYIPFSAGPRNCIGQKFAQMEEKMVMSALLKAFTIDVESTTFDPVMEIILRPAHGVKVRLTPRK